MLTRRNLMKFVAAAPAAGSALAAAPRNIAISSDNGARACARAIEMLAAGQDTLDAVIAGVNINGEDPDDTSVGYGGLPNEDGVVELDACVMHGPTRRAGSVASIRGIKTPSKIAKLVMTESDHVMLAGEGALRFAKAFGFAEENLLTEKSRLAWLVWKRSLRDPKGQNNWTDGLDAPAKAAARLKELFPSADDATLAWAWEMARYPPTGTINCLALNAKGEMSGVTTTSGLAWKIPGRVGDSPIIGAGLYVDGEIGAAGSTGRGEANLISLASFVIVESMRQGKSPKDAGMAALRRIKSQTIEKRLLNDRGEPNFGINFYIVNVKGEYAGVTMRQNQQGMANFAVCTENGPQSVPLEPLLG